MAFVELFLGILHLANSIKELLLLNQSILTVDFDFEASFKNKLNT
jgi:hypothetical protein